MEPDLVTQAPDVDLDLTAQEKEEIINWKMSGTSEDTDKLYCKLFLKQCHQLHDILPGLFEADSDYMELLFGISYTNKDDVIYMLVNPETGIPEADFNVSTLDEEGNPTGQVDQKYPMMQRTFSGKCRRSLALCWEREKKLSGIW